MQLKVFKLFVSEAEIMASLKHKCIVEFIEFDFETLSIIMELLPLGSLQGHIKTNMVIPWEDRYQFMIDLTEAMAFAHSSLRPDGSSKPEVFHQDLKSANILLYAEPLGKKFKLRAKVGDFGLACKFYLTKKCLEITLKVCV